MLDHKGDKRGANRPKRVDIHGNSVITHMELEKNAARRKKKRHQKKKAIH